MMAKWTLKQVTSDDGEKFHELRCGGVLCMLLPRGCLQMGWLGGDLKRFLGILNAHDGMLAALKTAKYVFGGIIGGGMVADHSANCQIEAALCKTKAAIALAKGGAS